MKQLIVAFVLIGALAGSKQQHEMSRNQTDRLIPAGQVGSFLPTFTAKDLRGHKIDSAELTDRVAIIDFWATWCAPCRKEMPGYQALLDKYGEKGLVVIGFKADMMADTENPISFIHELGIRYPILAGTEQIRNQFGGIQGLPATFIYDRKGILRKKIIGFEYTAVIEKIIQDLL